MGVVGFALGYIHEGVFVQHAFGIKRKHRGRGLAYLIFAHAMTLMRQNRVREAVGALVKVGPSHFARLGRPRRRYAIYAKELNRV